MRTFRFTIGLVASSLMAYSPVTMASMDLQQRNAFNQGVKSVFTGTYNDLYRKHSDLVDAPSRGLMEAWLKNNGKTQLPQPQVQIIKNKNGQEQMRIVLSQAGKTVTVTLDPMNSTQADINGRKIAVHELRNVQTVMNLMAEQDSGLAPLVKEMRTTRVPAPKKSEGLSPKEFFSLKPIERVEYMAHLRKLTEAAQKVMDIGNRKQATMEAPRSSLQAFLHPLVAIQQAQAEAQVKMSCGVAGWISHYETGVPSFPANHLACAADPKSPPTDYMKEAKRFHAICGQENYVACNPLTHGFDMNTGKPFCLDSTKQKGFTNYATLECNRMSPLRGEATSTERQEDYKRILMSYAIHEKKMDKDKVAACFGEDNRVKQECNDLFKDHQARVIAHKNMVREACIKEDPKKKTEDQTLACQELLKRDLEYAVLVEGSPVATVTIPNPPTACETAGGKAQMTGFGEEACLCKDGSIAVPQADGSFKCPHPCDRSGGTLQPDNMGGMACVCPSGKPAADPGNGEYEPCGNWAPLESRTGKPAPEECERESKKDSFQCSNKGWLLLLPLLLIPFLKKKKWLDPKTPPATLPPGPVLPTTLPPTPPPPPPGEGGSGTGGGNNGGAGRTTK